MINSKLLMGLMASAALCGCSTKPEINCSSADAQQTTISLLSDAIQKAAIESMKTMIGVHVSNSEVRASVAQLAIAIEDIRTTKEDPNSTKKFCTGKLTITFPAAMINDATEALANTQQTTIAKMADDANVDQQANVFSSSIDYNVQPTDDGSKVYAQVPDVSSVVGFYHGVVDLALLKKPLANLKAEAQAKADQEQHEKDAALAEQKAADLADAQSQDQLANQVLNTAWQALPDATKDQVRDRQRTWLRKRDADCKIEAMGTSTDPNDIEIARLRCDARVTKERVELIQHVIDQS